MNSPRFTPMSGMSRRGVLAVGGSVGIGALLAACGSSSDKNSKDSGAGSGGKTDAADAKAPAGPWSFTDDRKTAVKLDKAPTKLVAYVGAAAALHDYGVECVGVFGPTTVKNGSADAQAGDLDVSKLTVIGNTWGEFNIEKYAALSPELLISHMYEAPTLWYVPDESAKKILGIAPSVGINITGVPLTTPLQRYAELAASLGADMNSATNAAAKSRFEKAAADLRAAAKASGGIKVMATSGSTDSFYVSTPSSASDLSYYKSLGVDFIVPDKVEGGFFETLSWENADKYQPDIIMLDNRTATLQPKELAAKPTWTQLAAVKAGQVIGWPSEPIFSYDKCAGQIEALTKAITGAKKVN